MNNIPISQLNIPINHIYDPNFIHNQNMNLLNYHSIPNNAMYNYIPNQINPTNPNNFCPQNQIYYNPYQINQPIINQQIPFSINLPAHQGLSHSIPVNVQSNANYRYNYIGNINNNPIYTQTNQKIPGNF